MKKGIILFIITSVMAIGSSFGQVSPLSGFFNFKKDLVKTKLKTSLFDSIPVANNVFIRPYLGMSGTEIQFSTSGDIPIVTSFNYVAMGVSWQPTQTINGNPYSKFCGNFFATLPINLESKTNNFALGGTLGIFNNLLSFGGKWTPNPVPRIKPFSVLMNLSYAF